LFNKSERHYVKVQVVGLIIIVNFM